MFFLVGTEVPDIYVGAYLADDHIRITFLLEIIGI